MVTNVLHLYHWFFKYEWTFNWKTASNNYEVLINKIKCEKSIKTKTYVAALFKSSAFPWSTPHIL